MSAEKQTGQFIDVDELPVVSSVNAAVTCPLQRVSPLRGWGTHYVPTG